MTTPSVRRSCRPRIRVAGLAALAAFLGVQSGHGLTTSTRVPLPPSALSLWSDPEFQRRFTETYLAETEVEPRITDEERRQMQRILEALGAENVERAESLLERSRSAASSAVFDFTQANLHFQREEFSAALAAYQAAVAKHPRFRRAWRNMGLIQVRQGDHAGASTSLRRVIELGGGDAVTYGLLGFCLGALEDSLAAESAYRMAILLDPATTDWKMGLARALFRQERFADAAALCGRLLADEPGRADFWLLQANAFIGMDQPLRAAQNLEFVDQLGQSTADTLNMLGDIYVNQGFFEQAVSGYIRAVERDRRAGPARALRGARALAARGASTDARRLLDRVGMLFVGRLDENDRRELLRIRARVAMLDGASEEEIRVLEEITAIDPLDGEALILLGQHLARAGDPDRAILCYERAAGLEPHEADARVRHAQLLVGQGRFSEALPLLRRAQTIRPRESVQEYLEQVERAARSRG